MSVFERLKKQSKIKGADAFGQAKFLTNRKPATTKCMSTNIALDGDLDGGVSPGLLQIAGPSRHFKSNLGLLLCAGYLDKYPDAVMLFYDSEFGSKMEYFTFAGIDPNRVLHVGIKNIEELKMDVISQLDALDPKTENIIIYIDSIGNLASKKEVDDALNDNSAADMTRAKQLKSLWRMMTPYLQMKGVPCIAINHTYESMAMYGGPTVSGGTGNMYSSDDLWIIGRRQVKEGTEVTGYDFIINVEKSRTLKEKSKIPVSVSFDSGIKTHAALLDLALESGHVSKPKPGWYVKADPETGEILSEKNYRKADCEEPAFWDDIVSDQRFRNFIRKKYRLDHGGVA
jgi:RecA/RadA recombinase